jgi:hypothetical protein
MINRSQLRCDLLIILSRVIATTASGGGVRGGFAAPRDFLGGVGGEVANTTQRRCISA